MSEYRYFLCDIYEDDELLHEKVETAVYIGDGHLKEFSEKRRFKEAAEDVVEEKCLDEVERDYEGGEYIFKVIVTEVSTNQKRSVTVQIEAEQTVEFGVAVIEEKEYE